MSAATGVDLRAARTTATVAKLLDSATSILCVEGAAAVSVQRVATAAGTSKALVHYHFEGKEALLRACVERLAGQLIRVEAPTLDVSTPDTVLNDLWTEAMHPRSRALRRALLALTTDATEGTRAALAQASRERRRAAGAVIGRIGELMRLAPSVPVTTLGVAWLALIDGLTLAAAGEADAQYRRAFDAFWLAMLSLDR